MRRGRGGNMEEKFLKAGKYIKIWDDTERKFRYFLLTNREGPIRYPYTFSALSAGTKSDTKNFEDLNPSKKHLYQVFLGLRDGYYLYLWLPYDRKILKMDEATLEDIDEDSVALTYRDSPYENPTFSFWISRDKYPGIQIKNILGRTIYPQIVFIICKFEFMEILKTSEAGLPYPSSVNPELYDNLERNIVPATPVFSGAIP